MTLMKSYPCLGLAVSDLCCLITLVGSNILYTPAVIISDLPGQNMEVSYLIFIIPHLTFTRVSSWITAVIALERCLCIIAPLKVTSVSRRVCSVSAFLFSYFYALQLSVPGHPGIPGNERPRWDRYEDFQSTHEKYYQFL